MLKRHFWDGGREEDHRQRPNYAGAVAVVAVAVAVGWFLNSIAEVDSRQV
jgi:hypothetical protein